MTSALRTVIALALVASTVPALAEDAKLTFGGDQYAAGQHATIAEPVEHDAFLAGYDVRLEGPVVGDAHVAGFSVGVVSGISGNLYAVGYSVVISGAVGGDLTAAGNSVSVSARAPVNGNLRLAAAAAAISSPVTGSALITAQTLTLDAAIAGDLNFIGETLVFAPGALVTGKVLIRAPKEISVPASVASADRVTYEVLASPDYVSEAGRTAENVVRGFWPAFWAAAVWWLALTFIGAAFIALMPRGIARIETISVTQPLRVFGIGILAFAAVLGLFPVFAITVVGILLLPVVLIFVIVACSLAFLTGAYAIGVMVARRFISVDTNLLRLAVLAATLVAALLVGLVPILGWIMTLTVLVFGFGAVSISLVGASFDRARPQLPGADLPLTPAPQPAV